MAVEWSGMFLSQCCFRCPLFAFAPDADQWVLDYRCDGGSIRKRNPGVNNLRRNVSYRPRPCHVLFVGEAPGAEEDRRGIPFIGEAGKLLRKAIAAVYGPSSPWGRGITNVVRCRPPENRKPTDIEVTACLPRLLQEIKTRKPRVLVALGATALKALCDRAGIVALNGRVLPSLWKLPVIACLHPAYVLRNREALSAFVGAIERSRQVLENPKQSQSAGVEAVPKELLRALVRAVDRRSTKTKEA